MGARSDTLEPISTTIGGVKAAIDLLRSLRGMAERIKNADLNDKLMELEGVILELQGRLSELESSNGALRDEVRILRCFSF
jgi:hypothetical protein